MDLEKIKHIAKLCRQKVISQYELYEDDSLYGLCAIASACLYEDLNKNGIRSEFKISELSNQKHVYLSIDDINIDITASQFGFGPIEINKNKDQPWNHYLRFQTPAELHKYLKSINWNTEQLFELGSHVF